MDMDYSAEKETVNRVDQALRDFLKSEDLILTDWLLIAAGSNVSGEATSYVTMNRQGASPHVKAGLASMLIDFVHGQYGEE